MIVTTSNIIKGQYLALQLDQHLEAITSSKNDDDHLSNFFVIESKNIALAGHLWYKDIIYYLHFQKFSTNLESHKRRRLCIEASKYLI